MADKSLLDNFRKKRGKAKVDMPEASVTKISVDVIPAEDESTAKAQSDKKLEAHVPDILDTFRRKRGKKGK